MTIFDDHDYQITDEEYQDLVQKAIEQSMVTDSPLPQESGFVELDSMETTVLPPPQQNDGDDAELQRAIEESRNEPAIAPGSTDNDAELQRAIAASKEVMEKETSQRTEEDIVVEYVKKQSLAEEEFRRQRTKGKGTGLEETGEEDEELQRAMEESLRMNRGDDSGPSRT
ncbi:hypothetical protein PC129_g24882 [Phytophthora cactorum]|nr:hypothetical protein PC129_g24882 [Phytophthora cactorum]